VVVETTLGDIGLMICYDLRFTELCRSLVLKGAQMVAVVAQWPAIRVAHWDVLLRARAIENQVFVFGVNRCGKDGALVYGGHSRIVSPWGEVLARAGKGAARRPNISCVDAWVAPAATHKASPGADGKR